MLEIKSRHLTWGGPRYACNIFVLWQVYGEFGWDCKLGKCDLMANNHDFSKLKKIPPGFIMDLVAFIIPFMLIFVSYFYIWFYMWKSRKFFKSHGTRYILYGIFYANLLFCKNYLKWVDFFKKYIYNSSSTNQILSKNETKATFMLSLVCFSFILLVFPMILHDVLLEVFKFEKKEYNNLIHLALYFLYWLQYSLNFFIYAAGCQQYRRAYVYFFIEVCILEDLRPTSSQMLTFNL